MLLMSSGKCKVKIGLYIIYSMRFAPISSLIPEHEDEDGPPQRIRKNLDPVFDADLSSSQTPPKKRKAAPDVVEPLAKRKKAVLPLQWKENESKRCVYSVIPP